jgi:hypothetical protein
LCRHRHGKEADGVDPQLLNELLIELVTATVMNPGQSELGVLTKDGSGAEQRRHLALTVPIHRYGVRAIEHALMHGVLDLERLYHCARDQIIDLQPAA